METQIKRGRKKKAPGEGRDYVVTIRLTTAEGVMYKAIRDKMSMSESDFGRWLFLKVASKLM